MGEPRDGQRLVVTQSPVKTGRCLDDPAYALVVRRVAALERGLLASLEKRGLIPSPEAGAQGPGSGQDIPQDVAHLGPIEDGLSRVRGQSEASSQGQEQGQEKLQPEGQEKGQAEGQEKGQEDGNQKCQGDGGHVQELMSSVGALVGSSEKPAKELPENLPGPGKAARCSDQPADGQAKEAGAGQTGASPEGSSHRGHHTKPGQLLHNLIEKFQHHHVKGDGQHGKLSGQSPGQSRRHSAENSKVTGKHGEHGSHRIQESTPGQPDGQVHGQLEKVPSKGHLRWHSKAKEEEAQDLQKQSQKQTQHHHQSHSHPLGLWHHHSAPPAPGSLLGTPPLQEFYSMQQPLGHGHLGAVNICRCRATRRLYACKTIHKGELKNARHVEEVKMEILGMAQMQLRGGASTGTSAAPATSAGTGTGAGAGTGTGRGGDANGTSGSIVVPGSDTGSSTGTSTGPGTGPSTGSSTGAGDGASMAGGDGLQYVVCLYEVFDDEDAIHLITDYCEAGDLLHYVVSRGRLPEKECAVMVMQLATGLAAMHRVGLIHRDIKPENILLTKKERPHDKDGAHFWGLGVGSSSHLPDVLHFPQHQLPTAPQDSSPSSSENGNSHLASILEATHPHSPGLVLGLGHGHGHTQGGACHQQEEGGSHRGSGSQHHRGVTFRVGDFGSCVQMRAGEPVRGLVGSPKYMAPEVIRREPYGAPVDVWSLGVVLYACLVGRQPFVGEEVGEVFERACESQPDMARPPWAQISAEAKSLVSAMLQKDPLKRIPLQGVLHHPWVQRHCGGQVPGSMSKPPPGHFATPVKDSPIPLQC